MTWLITTYRPVSLFSLRASQTTSSGGRTNLVPTMYAVKMALLDAAFRSGQDGAELFDMVKALRVRFEPPRETVVSNTFLKIRREPKEKKPGGPAYISTVGFREFCYFVGDLRVALDIAGLPDPTVDLLRGLLAGINYLGKRGSFLQFLGCETQEPLGPGFARPMEEVVGSFPVDAVVQYLDDLGGQAVWSRVNSYSEESAKLGRDRVFVAVALPYRRLASSRGYTRYVRTV